MEPKNLREWLMVYKATTVGDTERATLLTLNHILESGLLEEKPVSKVELLPEDGHNDLAKAVKELISNMDSV